MSETLLVTLIGAFGGVLLGLAARMGRFCTMGAIEDALYGHDTTRLRMWGVSIGLSIVGVFTLVMLGALNLSTAPLLLQTWNPIASVIGGLMFGYGMALCGNCGYGALARLGGGDLRAFVIVLIMGVAGHLVLSGPLAPLRVTLFSLGSSSDVQSVAPFLSGLTGISTPTIGVVIGIVILVYSLADKDALGNHSQIFWAICVAFAIVLGWGGTYWVATNGFEAISVQSHSFVDPVGDTIQYAMNGSALTLKFGIGSVLGVALGAFIGSLIKGHFRWEACEDPRELRRQIFGAAIMGIGAVIAMGCSVGQGISAFAVLSYSAPVTLAAIFVGAAVGLRQLIYGFQAAE
jgi:uncharacterized membrane protein YedE/YeeE